MPLLAGGSERPWEPVVGTPLWPSSLPHCWQVQANAIFTLAMAIAIAGLNGNDNMVLGNAKFCKNFAEQLESILFVLCGLAWSRL